ncbi:SDR family NAD(P)-dependent oxidoreductase [Desmospora activa]|uniref:3-oxoacyl-[acyl-carrier protein] reductase n=1 Tax=Desmospora activa DSM 45169 TaxID=1121389 RepID=A0A2T4Z3S8_9BACL|nr:SDR family NAD(P)-dependent oxidoreductase [Desmospora activa]PTM56554.1 3-oxoacyl-[acyl-carrier protein] reductase [Desmospora activa DSM 45169]
MNLEKKVAVITGASRGIGRSIALNLAKQGVRLVVNGTNVTRLNELAEEIHHEGQSCVVVAGDASHAETAADLVQAATKHYGSIDILVNNAGINLRRSTLETELQEWKKVLDINVTSAFLLCKAVLPVMMKQRKGKIINISSTTAKTPHKNASPAYGVSKAGLNYLTMHLAQEMAEHNIHVNAVCPGPIETDMSKQWSEPYRAAVIDKIPLKRIGKSENVADLVSFLASDLSDFITGQTIHINGGSYMN